MPSTSASEHLVTSTARGRRPRRISWAVVAGLVVVAAAFYGAAHLLDGRYAWARAVAWGESDTGDQLRFPERVIRAGTDVSPLPEGDPPAFLDEPVNLDDTGVPLERWLAATDTRALLVLQHDRLVHEWYADGVDPEDRQTSFSAAKSFVSTLVGIAVDEGSIAGVDDPVTAYLPELAERDPRFEEVTLRHLLTMSSGLRYVEEGLPWSDDALTYYGTDLRELALEHTEVEGPPGETWHYNNYNPLLLGLVLERATGMPVSEYMATRLWQPLGAEADASWSLDSDASGFEKLESGVNARPRDFARFGLMMLHDGRWNGRQIVPSGWVHEATASDTTTDPSSFYQYLWWVTPGAGAQRWPFFAMGKFGQLVGVFPEHDAVVVRLGSDTGDVDWRAALTRIADQLG